MSDARPPAPDTEPATPRGWDEFAPLYDAHHERLYRVALLLTHGSAAQAEDAVAETFLRVYPVWSEDRVDNFFGFARQTLVHHVLGQRSGGGAGARQATNGDGDRSPDDSVADASTTFRLLEQLAPSQRTAVVLRYFEDLSYDQIASTMGVTPGTAKAEVSVGLQRMRALMGDDGATS